MRVINKNLELPLGRNYLEPAGNLRRFAETENSFAQTDAERGGGGERGQRIRDVETADERHAHEITFAARVELVGRARKFHSIVGSAKIGAGSHSEGHHRNFLVDLREQLTSITIVDVDDRNRFLLFLLLRELLEQFRFRFEIVFHRSVIIEMVLCQISEDGDVPLDPAGALLGKRVGRDFQGRTPASA